MNHPAPAPPPSKASHLKVKGRMMLQEDFTERLRNFCSSLGFAKVRIWHSDTSTGSNRGGEIFAPAAPSGDAVILLSCRVAYNPDWGGLCGLPQLRAGQGHGNRSDPSPAAFIAPFLRQYRFAQEHVYLTETGQGSRLITMPESLVKKAGEQAGSHLLISLDKVAEPDGNGDFVPVMISGSMLSYTLGSTLRQTLSSANFAWKAARSIPIGRHLGSELFSFANALQSVAPDSPFRATLLPHLGHIVAHRTPNLRAAELHLSQQFARAVTTCLAENRRAGSGNMLCLAGLDIDMSSFRGQQEHYFVPWQAYLETSGGSQATRCALEQDDLFVRLMQQA